MMSRCRRGQAVTGKNFGNYRPVTVSGSVFNDANADGFKDSGESGLSGWKVFIDTDQRRRSRFHREIRPHELLRQLHIHRPQAGNILGPGHRRQRVDADPR